MSQYSFISQNLESDGNSAGIVSKHECSNSELSPRKCFLEGKWKRTYVLSGISKDWQSVN